MLGVIGSLKVTWKTGKTVQFSDVCGCCGDRGVTSPRLCSWMWSGSHHCPAQSRHSQIPNPASFFTCKNTCITGLREGEREQKGSSIEVGLKILGKLFFTQSPKELGDLTPLSVSGFSRVSLFVSTSVLSYFAFFFFLVTCCWRTSVPGKERRLSSVGIPQVGALSPHDCLRCGPPQEEKQREDT